MKLQVRDFRVAINAFITCEGFVAHDLRQRRQAHRSKQTTMVVNRIFVVM